MDMHGICYYISPSQLIVILAPALESNCAGLCFVSGQSKFGAESFSSRCSLAYVLLAGYPLRGE